MWQAAWWLVLLALASAEDGPPGLVSKDSDQDLVAEATHAATAQKREASLSNSYGEPIPADAYGPPKHIPINVPEHPAPVYGVPDLQANVIFPSGPQQTPPGAYGPPSPVHLPSVSYEGPPPPVKQTYGPPKSIFKPPKVYGPPKPVYGVPKKGLKQSLPKPTYGVPFKNYGPPKISFPKPSYGPPKPLYGPPKPAYGVPKALGSVLPSIPNLPYPELPPIYGTPINLDLKPNFGIPSETYGPPGHIPGPIGPDLLLHDIGNHLGHYGPPQPDPNPRPPHPGIPAPPTPPHVIYDGWKPIPGQSKPFVDHADTHLGHLGHHDQDHYGPPPPPPGIDINFNIGGHSLPNIAPPPLFAGAQISTGYSSVHQDALANLDLNAIVGGDSNHIDQSKTVFEAHYTEPHQDLAVVHASIPTSPEKFIDSYGAPPLDSFSANGPYPASIRQHGPKGLGHGGHHGGGHHGHHHHKQAHLPLPHGTLSGSSGGHSFHTGGSTPTHPIKFREPVPAGLIQDIGSTTHHKDHHLVDHIKPGHTYNPPPVRDVKDHGHHTGNHGVSFSIEPTNLYSLPHSGHPMNFNYQEPSGQYGSPIDSYTAPFLTVGDHTASASNDNAISSTLDGSIFANLSNLEAAAILKHCPYHEAIIKAARYGEKISPEVASSYVASLSSLGSSLSKNNQILISPQNAFNIPAPGSESVSYNTKDLATASHTLVETILPAENSVKQDKPDNGSNQKGKSLKSTTGKQQNVKQDSHLNLVSEQILKTSEKIKNLSEETQKLQQKIVTTSQNIHQVNGQIAQTEKSKQIPGNGQHASYSVQIESSANGKGGKIEPSIPHEQLLSEGLLQSILQAIEQPNQPQKPIHLQHIKPQNIPSLPQIPQKIPNLPQLDNGGLILPAGYEPVDRTKQNQANIEKQIHNIQQQKLAVDQEIQSTHNNIQQILNNEIVHRHRGDIPHTECDLKPDNSITHTIVVPPPSDSKPVQEIDENDVAIFFGENRNTKREVEDKEPVTEISVRASVSEKEDRRNAQQYGVKSKDDFGKKIAKTST